MKKKNGGFKVFQEFKELLGIDNPEVGGIDELDELDGIEAVSYTHLKKSSS